MSVNQARHQHYFPLIAAPYARYGELTMGIGGRGFYYTPAVCSLAAPPLHKRRKGLVRRRYPSCSAGMQLTSRAVTIFYASPRSARARGEELTAQNVPQLFKFTTWHAAIFYVYHFHNQ